MAQRIARQSIDVESIGSIRPSEPGVSESPSYPPGFDPAAYADEVRGILSTLVLLPADDEEFRAAELKHGRVAMAATVGWIIQETGITFPGKISLDGTTFASLSNHGTDAWAQLSLSGKLQILFTVGMFEFYTETIKPHYMSGGKVGYAGKIWDPIGFTRGVPEITGFFSDASWHDMKELVAAGA